MPGCASPRFRPGKQKGKEGSKRKTRGAAYLVAAVGLGLGLGLLAGAHGVAARRRAGLPRDLCRGRNGARCCLLGCGLRLPLLPWF